jgi:branched-chain amino acid transport system permease protein
MSGGRARNIIVSLAIIAFLAVLPFYMTNLYWLGVMITMLINVLIVSSFWLIMTTGQVNLGHAAFAAIGAYMSAALVSAYGFSSWLSLPLALIVAGVVALVIGVITLRITGIYFIITTIALAEVTKIVFGMWEHPFGGLVGILNLKPPAAIAIPGLPVIQFTSKQALYYLVLVCVLIGVSVVRRLEKSSIGLIFRSIQNSDNLAEHVGINIMAYKVLAFVVGSMCAALGGVLYTYTTGAILPTSFTMTQANYYIVWAAVGGLQTFAGPLVGTVALSVLSEYLRPVKEFEPIIYAGLLIFTVLVFKGGLLGAAGRAVRPLVGRFSARGSGNTPVREDGTGGGDRATRGSDSKKTGGI